MFNRDSPKADISRYRVCDFDVIRRRNFTSTNDTFAVAVSSGVKPVTHAVQGTSGLIGRTNAEVIRHTFVSAVSMHPHFI